MRQLRSSGFTLIELIIVVGIIILLTGGGIAAFIRFNDRQSVQAGARELQTILRSAQVKARAGEKPAGCDRLTGYQVQTTINTSQVVLSAVCQDTGGSPQIVLHSTEDLPNGVIAEDSYSITFNNLYGGVTGATDIVLSTGGAAAIQYSFEVTDGGEISDGAFLP